MTGTHTQIQLPDLASAEWLTNTKTRSVLDALETRGHDARVVGGAVRNALFGQPVNDVDIATTASPDEVLAAAQAANLKAVPTGFKHGTITLVADAAAFEVTTLRRDVETDGRHARVVFTDNWLEDAKRRDFTINAIYCDKSGILFDPVGGIEDINLQRVRFIGDADQRIAEDYLRILRFFRFTATYGNGMCDAAGLTSCRKLRAGLDSLTGERIWSELKKLLVAQHSGGVVQAMHDNGILARLFQPVCTVERLQRLIAIDRAMNQTGHAIQRLAALAVHKLSDAVWLRDRLRLSSREFDRLALIATADDLPTPGHAIQSAYVHIYRNGADAFQDAILLAWAASDAPSDDAAWHERFTLPHRWQAPDFLLSGADVLALGVDPGPKVGAILADVERWWISEGFPDDLAGLRQRLADRARVTKS